MEKNIASDPSRYGPQHEKTQLFYANIKGADQPAH